MDNGGGNPPASDESQKDLSVALAASSMINASDMINAEAYQANVQRIHAVQEMVRKLEFNNEAAHRNFLVDQLEKRAKEGREAENMLAELRSQPGLPATVQLSNNVPSGDVLPTTATLVEVPDSHPSPSHSSAAPSVTSYPPQSVQQSRNATYQWSSPQIQPYPTVFRHYVPPTIYPSFQHSAVPHPQTPVDTGHWHTMQNPPPRPRVHNPSAQTGSQPIQAQHPVRSWVSYAPQVPSAADVASGYHTSAGQRSKPAPIPSVPSSGSSNLTHRGLGVSTQSVTSRFPFITHNQPSNSTPRAVPFQSVPAVPAKPLAQTPIGSYSKPPESQSQPVSTTVSNQVATSGLQQSRELPEQHQLHRQQPQRLSVPQLQPEQQQSQCLRPLQPPIQLQSRARQSQQPLHPPQSHQLPPPPSADRLPSTNASQPHAQPQPINVQEQSCQRGTQTQQVDQATFIKHFHNAVQRGVLPLKAFWFYAKASGISDEWFRIAIDSLPPNVWNAIVTRVTELGPTLETTPSASASRQQVPTVPSSNALVASAAPPPTAVPLGQMTSTTQRSTESSISSEGDSASRLYNESYAPQLQYYAEQATKSAHLTQTLGISTSLQGIAVPTQITVTTPKRDAAPQITANGRTPKDANKSTLARDVLRALGNMAQKPSREMGSEPMDEANNHEADKLPEVNISPSISHPATAKPPATLLEPVLVEANPPWISSANSNVQDVPQGDISPSQSIVKPVLRAEHRQPVVDEGPIMIDLTLEDSDGPIDGKEQEPNLLIQASTNAVISPQAVSPINTTNHTPLLENISLEEPTVALAGDSDNADIYMRSPALAMSAEENTGPELMHPLPGAVEPVSQSFEPLPGERNEDELDGQLPLFLPSPPASPAPTEPPVTDFEEDETRPPLKGRSMDVDEMEIDRETETPRVQKRQKQQVYVFIPAAPLYVKRAKMKERIMAEGRYSDSEGVGQDEELRYSHLEQLLIEESRSRLLERRCLWSNCGAILNSAGNLLAHLKNHACEETSEAPFLCRWTSCEKQFGTEQERDVHLERHATKPLPCSFAGCDKQFDKPVEVMQHEVQHQKTDDSEPLVRKPTCQPIVPAIPARLGQPPHWLPSHRVMPRRVAKCQITADRHAIVGPWVLWNIFSPVELNMRKQNASMRGRPTRQATNYEMDSLDPRRDDYDFLVAISPPCTKEAPLDDLDSGAITMSAARGLTLWGLTEGEVLSRRQSHEEDSVERML